MTQAKNIKAQLDKLQIQMQAKWEMLDPSNKAHYKQKLTRFKDSY